MKTKVCMLLICLFAIASLGLAQAKVDGKWTGEIAGGRGPQAITITLKNDGGKLTGSTQGGRGGETPIEEGTVSGNTIMFTAKGEVAPKGEERAEEFLKQIAEKGGGTFTRYVAKDAAPVK